MRNVILLMHVSLDDFVAGPNGEMDWIQMDEQVIDDVAELTDSADTALFGRVTYEMMAGYWPTAADAPTASKHDIDHARWVNPAPKLVFSRTLETVEWENSRIVRDNIPEEIQKLKAQPGKNLLMIGSTSTAHTFMQLGLIDEYRINVNPVVLGSGMPLFAGINEKIALRLLSAKTYACGVVGLHYAKG
ncbi:MAG: dihydrofolate reductase family protein [Chloroflexi bacterium]|nr:dihydrofolate reductase family protein [Chloroflexota bacterium]